jgi:DNA-binding winged helix-turn-helix (wHTH) protein
MAEVYEFGPFRLDCSERVPIRGSDVIPLTPKAADTLIALVVRHGHLVDKGGLLRLVWPGTNIEEGGLARNISLLRKTLGDDDAEPQYIETVPRRGYRFIAPIREPAATPSPRSAGWYTAAPGRRRG